MSRYNDKAAIRDHYDRVSPYYENLWGEHLHHGYWIRGDESKEIAQVQLIQHLAEVAKIKKGSKILDVGCGLGASSIYLAKHYQAEVTGITISPVQVEMARRAAAKAGVPAQFLLMDAEVMEFQSPFDVLWSVESISHYQQRGSFFAAAANVLRNSGTMAIIDWFKRENVTPRENRRFLQPIERGMLVELQSMKEYEELMALNGLEVTHREILNENCAKTWDICLEMIANKAFWHLAAENGARFVRFLQAFKAMRAGFASHNFIYGLLVAKKG